MTGAVLALGFVVLAIMGRRAGNVGLLARLVGLVLVLLAHCGVVFWIVTRPFWRIR